MKHRAGRLHHRARGVVLARDEADLVVLAAVLLGDEAGDLRGRIRGASGSNESHGGVSISCGAFTAAIDSCSRKCRPSSLPGLAVAAMLVPLVLCRRIRRGCRGRTHRAAPVTPDVDAGRPQVPKRHRRRPRRSARGLGGASGYPNSSSDIGNPAYYSAERLHGRRTAARSSSWAPLSDYLSFGFWFGTRSFRNGDWRSTARAAASASRRSRSSGSSPRSHGLGSSASSASAAATSRRATASQPEASGDAVVHRRGAFYEWSFGQPRSAGTSPSVRARVRRDLFAQPSSSHGLVASVSRRLLRRALTGEPQARRASGGLPSAV